MIQLKDKSVNVEGLTSAIKSKIIDIALACREIQGENYIMTITSAKDGKHMSNSKHYSGNAIDIRTRDMKEINDTAREIKFELGEDYDVIVEKDHIHIEYDPNERRY